MEVFHPFRMSFFHLYNSLFKKILCLGWFYLLGKTLSFFPDLCVCPLSYSTFFPIEILNTFCSHIWLHEIIPTDSNLCTHTVSNPHLVLQCTSRADSYIKVCLYRDHREQMVQVWGDIEEQAVEVDDLAQPNQVININLYHCFNVNGSTIYITVKPSRQFCSSPHVAHCGLSTLLVPVMTHMALQKRYACI